MSKYYAEGITHIIEADPKEISIKLLGTTLRAAGVNGVNGTYFDVAHPANPNTVWGIAVQDGKPIGSGVTTSYQGYKRGTVYFTRDGKLDTAVVNTIAELPPNLQWAISGCMVYPNFDYVSQGFVGNHSDVWNHTCNRTGIGIKGGKVYLFARASTDINRFIQTCQNLGLEKAVMLDSGGSTQLNWNGHGIASARKISTAVVVNSTQGDTTSVSTNTTTYPLVKIGSKGDTVKTLQQKLNALGFNCGVVDGVFGNATLRAVLNFQKSKGLPQDGIVGEKTWDALLGDD